MSQNKTTVGAHNRSRGHFAKAAGTAVFVVTAGLVFGLDSLQSPPTDVRRGPAAAPSRLTCETPRYEKILDEMQGATKDKAIPFFKSRMEKGFEVLQKSASVDLDGAHRNVKYNHYLARTQPAKGTVFFFCGGPGVRCTKDGRPPSLPKDVDVILFDYVGLGHNKFKDAGPEAMSIESQGRIGAEIIKQLNLKDFTIYGQSFGTAVGTVTASILSREVAAPQPKMVVLDGILGNAATTDSFAAHRRIADNAWALLTEKERAEFTAAYRRYVIPQRGERRSQLDAEITADIEEGPVRLADGLRDFVAAARTGRVKSRAPDHRHERDQGAPEPDDEPGFSFDEIHEYRAAGCQITTGAQTAHPSERYFGLIPHVVEAYDPRDPQLCDCPLLKRRYDAKNFQIHDVPVVYVESATDPKTPIEGARYHLENQNATGQKFFFETKNGPHAELESRYADCIADFWRATLTGQLELVKRETAKIGPNGCPEKPVNRPNHGATVL